jgi:hypothetical protein
VPIAAVPEHVAAPTVVHGTTAPDDHAQCYQCENCQKLDREIILMLREEVDELNNEVRTPINGRARHVGFRCALCCRRISLSRLCYLCRGELI